MIDDLREQPWWTPADRAELDDLCWRYVDATWEHRLHCEDCQCQRFRDALQAILDWREGRIRRSRAEWLREQQEGPDT